MGKVIVVSDEQYIAARRLVRISGGIDKVEPLIAKIAQAKPATAEQKRLAVQSYAQGLGGDAQMLPGGRDLP